MSGYVNILGLVCLLTTATALAQEILATPGTYELLEGTSIQFDGRTKENANTIERYQWSIISGAGANLLNADQSRVTFVLPSITEKTRLFTLQLTSYYRKAKPSKAQINIRVHRKNIKTVRRSSSPWLSGTLGFGFGYLWGGWWPYPPLIVITPPPGEVLPPELLPPVALPRPEDPSYEDWVKGNPDLVLPPPEDRGLSPDSGGGSIPPAIAPDIEPLPEAPTAVIPEQPIESAPEPIILPVAPEPMPLDRPEATPMDILEGAPLDLPDSGPMDMPMDLGID